MQVSLTIEEDFRQGLMAFAEIDTLTPAYDLNALYINILRKVF
jgi:hypothetical protein